MATLFDPASEARFINDAFRSELRKRFTELFEQMTKPMIEEAVNDTVRKIEAKTDCQFDLGNSQRLVKFIVEWKGDAKNDSPRR